MPYQTQSLNYNEKNTYYTPQSDKFLGYSQFPNPRCIPYYNEKLTKLQNNNYKEKIKHIEKNYCPKNELNLSLFKYKTNNDLGVSYLSSTLLDKKKAITTGKISILKERQMNDKMINSLPNTAKIINNKKLPYPNDKLFITQMIKVKQTDNLLHEKKRKELEEAKAKAKFDLKINTERFTKKSQSLEHKSVLFQSIDQTHEKKLNEFYKSEASKFFDVGSISKRFEGINTKTFDGSVKLNFDWETMPIPPENEGLNVKTEKMMDEKIKRQREELEGFKVKYFFFFNNLTIFTIETILIILTIL